MDKELQLLTNSKRACFLKCPRKFCLKYELCRAPIREARALSFGKLIHSALEAWWQGDGLGLDAIFDGAFESARESGGDPYEIAKARAMMVGYTRRYSGDDADYETVAVEAEYRAPLLNPDTNAPSRTWVLAGKIDAIAKDRDGKIIIVEHKTTSDSVGAESKYWRKLTIDGQVSGYQVGALKLGYEPVYCLYDVLAKPKHQPKMATPEAERKYTKDGKLYAVQRETDETPMEYGERVFNAIMDEPEKYYSRRDVVRLESEIEKYYRDMWAIGLMIRSCQLGNIWPHNGNACTEFGGCEYFDVCAGFANINDDSMFATVDPNPELSEGQK
jgi:hypothetical protein